MKLVGLVTCESLPSMDKDNQILYKELIKKFKNLKIVTWNDSNVDWENFEILIVRSLYDYLEHYEEFQQWLIEIKNKNIKIFNPVEILSWNAHKKYLIDLESSGVEIIPSLYFNKGTKIEIILEALSLKNWEKFVFKPCVGNGSKGVFLVQSKLGEWKDEELKWIGELSNSDDFLCQEFQSSIHDGEISLIYFQGNYSHGVLRKPEKNEFRQNDFQTVTKFNDNEKLIKLGKDTIEKLLKNRQNVTPHELLYSRVDLIKRNHSLDEYFISEVELFEPVLYFNFDEKSIERFSNSISKFLK
jgi:glutathione synthase/RimK-type ligase-like ATP-grasp enzyme